jgi:hypothetical protein
LERKVPSVAHHLLVISARTRRNPDEVLEFHFGMVGVLTYVGGSCHVHRIFLPLA